MATLMYVTVRPALADIAIGGSSADFLQFEIGGRSAGMAGAHTGIATGVTAQFWNPAALATLDQPQIGAMHATWLGDLSYEWLGYARPVSPKLGVGSVSVAYFHMPSIAGVDEYNNPTGDFNVYDLAVTFGLARPIGRGVNVGANAKLIRQNLATVSATGAAVDLGTSATIRGTTIGAVIQNLGPSLSFDGAPYPLPQQVKFGASRGFLKNKLLVAADYNMPRDYYNDVRLGTEFRAHQNVSLRLGYRHELGSEGDPANGLSYGLGLHYSQLQVDYAMTPSNDFDNIHRLSFGYSFGSGGEERKPEKPKPEPKKKTPPPPAPTGPAVIAAAKAPKAQAPAAAKTAPQQVVEPQTVAQTPAQAPAQQTIAKAAPAPVTPRVEEAPKPAEPAKPVGYDVVLPGYSSKESAQAELKALELLGFRIKDAQIVQGSNGAYQVMLARLKSKSGADDMAASLSRMSFRALVVAALR
ncbi:MAG TPA: PorV/PorQ family protein [Candidatus Eisenbacteria bacterium]|nr:PorV/PorQ family protein [Candidatus Eisenbacteria bacterium]